MGNILQIKRGTSVPVEGGLAPYEFGYVVSQYYENQKIQQNSNSNAGYLYIADLFDKIERKNSNGQILNVNGEIWKEDEGIDKAYDLLYKPQKIRAGYADMATVASTAKKIGDSAEQPLSLGNETTPIYLKNGTFYTCTGSQFSSTAENANLLTTPRQIGVDLSSSTFLYFNGSQDITTGASGVLPIAKGGTGATDANSALKNLGIDVSADYLNYSAGLTGNIQEQLDNKLSKTEGGNIAGELTINNQPVLHTGNNFSLLISGQTLSTESKTFIVSEGANYSVLIFCGIADSSESFFTSYIPTDLITTEDQTFMLSNYSEAKIFYLRKEDNNIVVTNKGYAGSGSSPGSISVYGVK